MSELTLDMALNAQAEWNKLRKRIASLEAEVERLKSAISTVIIWSEFEVHYCPKCGEGDPVADSDYVSVLRAALQAEGEGERDEHDGRLIANPYPEPHDEGSP